MLSDDVVVRKIRNQTILSTVTVPRKMEGFRKVIFEHSNANGEYELESAWATKVSDHYKLDNILFYAPEYVLLARVCNVCCNYLF